MENQQKVMSLEIVEARIIAIRGERVILDADLAELYGVPTKVLNQAVRRNQGRFPDDFMFQLTAAEKAGVVTNCDHLQKLKFSAALPLAFTEHGAIMAANLLNSQRAVDVSVFVVRAFVRLRRLVSTHHDLARKLDELERKVGRHDRALAGIIETLRQLTATPDAPRRSIGFRKDDSNQ